MNLNSQYFCLNFLKKQVLRQFIFRPDGEKKAYVRLAPDYDALDVANKVNKLKETTQSEFHPDFVVPTLLAFSRFICAQ